MKEICEDLKSNARKLVEKWDRKTRGEPWASLPKDYRVDHLPDVLSGLVEASLCRPLDEEAHSENLWAAVNHGSQRRKQGVAEHVLFREYHLLREVIWRYLRKQDYPDLLQAITRIDAAISLALMGSLRGFYRAELEEAGQWGETIDWLLQSSPFLHEGG